jgi:hypothetical protein
MSTDLSQFPEIVQDLAEAIGLPATVRLVEQFPGVRLYVPKKPTPGLIELIGQEPTEQLVAIYGGELVPIPRCVVALRARRNAQLFAARIAGKSLRELALAFALSERHVCRILVAGPDNDAQLDLFAK